MPSVLEPIKVSRPRLKPGTKPGGDLAPTYHVVCWNDPVNLMVFVTHVFMRVFGWNQEKAQKHMLEVHEKGRSILAREGAEKAEFYVHQLQQYKLQATMEPAE
jgi:ATP-dependent Clp protease adapter protein ClpS